MKRQLHPTVGLKTLAPSLETAIERAAALAALCRSSAPAKWLAGPSGSGKSTLVAAHVHASHSRFVWYRIDARDDDPAFFYANLRAAIENAFGAAPVPDFADDDRARELDFAERFFSAVLAQYGEAAFVFDNVHLLEREPMQHAIARFAALARGSVEIWFIGERPPPSPFFDVVSARQLALCNDVPLAFDADECLALARAARLPVADGRELAALTGGHAGALVLACEFLRDSEVDEPAAAQRAFGQIHRHLLARLLEHMPSSRREVLLRTSFAPQFDASIAQALVGRDVARELDDLHAQGLLRRMRTDRGAIYEAHGLVRNGLVAVLQEQLGTQGALEWAQRTAAVLHAAGFDDDAFALLVAHSAAEPAADLLEGMAKGVARQGQAQLLVAAISKLPPTIVDRRPWLCFWAGHALLGVDEERARGWFERAYAEFAREGRSDAMRLAAASVITAFGLEYGDLRTLDAWMDRYAAAGGDQAVPEGAPDEAALCIAIICAAIVRGAYPPGLDADVVARRVRVLIDVPQCWFTPDEPVAAARLLIDHARIFRTPEQAQAFVLETRAVAEQPTAGALQRGRWAISAACAYFENGEPNVAATYFERARKLADETGSPRLAVELGLAEIDAALKQNDVAAASRRLRALDSIIARAPPAQRAEHARLTARVLLSEGRYKEGLRWADEALATSELAGYSGGNARIFHLERIYGLAANDRLDDALRVCEAMLEGLEGTQREGALTISNCLRFLTTGETDVALLRDAMQRAASIGFVNLLARARGTLRRILEAALAHDVERDFVLRLIAHQQLDPKPGAGPQWPWSVRVRTLGSFELEVGGVRYKAARKAQDKPLELLKLLVACQAFGRDSAHKDWTVERLWADAELHKGRKSLEMALSRLRRLLGRDDAITLIEGRLQLSPTRVWTDVGALMRAARRAGVHRDALARGIAPATIAARADVTAFLAHYRGPFLPEEVDAPWVIAAREATAAAVRSALVVAEEVLAGCADDALVPALERAFATDATSEDLARALMRALTRQGQHSEALRIYRRLREMLSIVLSLAPSQETNRLKDQIYAGMHAGDVPANAVRAAADGASP